MAACAEILQKNVTNHSMRRPITTTLQQGKTDSLNIAGLSGHRNLMSLDDYSSVNEQEQREISALISKRIHGSSTGNPNPTSSSLLLRNI